MNLDNVIDTNRIYAIAHYPLLSLQAMVSTDLKERKKAMAYSKDSIIKYVHIMKACIDGYTFALQHETPLQVAISNGNRKIGRVMNVSTAAMFTCGGNCRECKNLCYDIKAALQYGNVLHARGRNTAMAKHQRGLFFSQIDTAMTRRRRNKYFRWHVAGDVIDADYLERMIENARRHQDFTIWTYTKQYHIVNDYVRAHGGNRRKAIPANLTIMFSEWRGLRMENPYHFPEFRVIFKGEETPSDATWICPGNCDVCKEQRRGCIVGETTYAKEH